jgi:hypothetical protein
MTNFDQFNEPHVYYFSFMLFIFVLPAIQVILFCLAIGREPLDMKFGVVNHEVPGLSICHGPAGCTTQNLSCRYLDNIPKASVNLVSQMSGPVFYLIFLHE